MKVSFFTVMLVSIPTHLSSGLESIAPFSTYVIDRSFSLTFIINDMERIKNLFKSKKPALGPIRGPGQATSTSTLRISGTDLMPTVLSCDSVASAQVTADFNVSIQLRQFHLLTFTYCLLSRPPVILESLPRFPLQRSAIFLL